MRLAWNSENLRKSLILLIIQYLSATIGARHIRKTLESLMWYHDHRRRCSKKTQNTFWDTPPAPPVFRNYVNSIGPMFHSIYELKQRMEGIKLRWAIPWIFAQTWNWSQPFCSPGWCYIGYLFLWLPLQVPAMEVMCICTALFPLCSLWELTEIFPCSLWLELGGWEGWKLMAVSRGLTNERVGKKRRHYPPPRGPVEFRLKVQQENKLSSCTPELCCQFEKH